MENKKLHLGVKEIREVKMTADEKKRVLENILNSSVSTREPIRSPWIFYSFITVIRKNRVASYGLASLLLVSLGGGSVLASANSLPGNILYPLKVSVVEPVRSVFSLSPEDKARYESSLAVKRLMEAEILASRNELDPDKEAELNLLLESHTEAMNKAIGRIALQSETGVELNDDIVIDFRAQMNAHARVLDVVNERRLAAENVKNIEISETARTNAGKAREAIQKKEGKTSLENYKKRKDAVQSIVDSTDTRVRGTNSDNSSEHKKAIIQDANKTLDQARQFLKEAEEEDQKGNSQNAYSRLLDSESSAREAGIFLETGLNLKED